jgi:hypothetical protein
LRNAYAKLQDLIEELYATAQIALDNDDFLDASVLQSRADKLYEEVEDLGIIISKFELE